MSIATVKPKSYAELTRRKKIPRAVFDHRETATERGYNSRWRKARSAFLRRNPLCARCLQDGRVEPANVVDHITPHKGSKELFWNCDNWQALCTKCHNAKTATEDGGFGRETSDST